MKLHQQAARFSSGRARLRNFRSNGMLVLSRKPSESIQVGDNITITIVKIGPNAVKLGHSMRQVDSDSPYRANPRREGDVNFTKDQAEHLIAEFTTAYMDELNRFQWPAMTANDCAETAADTLRSILIPPPKLEWMYERNGHGQMTWMTSGYYVEVQGEGDFLAWIKFHQSPHRQLGFYKTLAEAKAAAQAHFEREAGR